MKSLKKIEKFLIIFLILLFLFLFFRSAYLQRLELQDIQNKGKEYMEQGEYVLALETFEKIGPDWMDNSEWIEKAEQEIMKLQEEGVCPFCGHKLYD